MKLSCISAVLLSVNIALAAYITNLQNGSKCMDVRGGAIQTGAAVEIYDCNGSAAQNWLIDPTTSSIQLVDTTFCLDAAPYAANGVGVTMSQCNQSASSQTWTYTEDRQIQSEEDQNECLDLPNGDTTNGNQLQTYQCGLQNVNQIWAFAFAV